MTQKRGLGLLRRYMNTIAYMPKPHTIRYLDKSDFRNACFDNQSVAFFIELVRKNPLRDPRDILREYYEWMDGMIEQSTNKITWLFCTEMRNSAHAVLIYMAEQERSEK